MVYKIVERFGPEDGETWTNYLRGCEYTLTRFDSVDGILRPDLFEPKTHEDWLHSVGDDCQTGLIKDLDYAVACLPRYKNAVIVGVDIDLDAGYSPGDALLGYDVIDEYNDVSLLTNCLFDPAESLREHVIPHIMSNGLVGDLSRALAIRDRLRTEFPENNHARGCRVWAIYDVAGRVS